MLLARTPGDYRLLSYNPYLAMSAGASDLYGFDPMLLARYAEFLAYAQGMEPDDLVVTRMGRVVPALGLLRLRYTFRVEGTAGVARFADLKELPRALLVRDLADCGRQGRTARRPHRSELRRAGNRPARDRPRSGLRCRCRAGIHRAESVPSSASVAVVDISSDILEVRAETPAPAILLLTDNYSAGWKVTSVSESSRQDYAILPADHTLRGIPLTAGAHHLRLEYRPTAFVVGSWLTVLSLAAYGLAVFRAAARVSPSGVREGVASFCRR